MNKFNCEILALARESRGLTQVELSKLLNVEQGTISKIENGKMEISVQLIEPICQILDYPKHFFYSDKKIIKVEGHFRKKTTISVKAIKQYVAKMTLVEWNINKLSDAIELPAPNIPSWDIEVDGSPEAAAKYLRQYWRIPRGRIEDIASIIEDNGIIIAPLDLGEMDGLSTFSSEFNIPIIYINRNKPVDRIRHTLAHELGHYVCHFGKKITNPDRDIEEEAKAFASELLMPENEILGQLINLNIEKLGDLKRYWKTSMQSILVRAEKLKSITKNQSRYLWTQIGKLGYRKNEPFPLPPDNISLLREIVDAHIHELGYTKDDLSEILGLSKDTFEHIYYGTPLKPRFSVRKNNVA